MRNKQIQFAQRRTYKNTFRTLSRLLFPPLIPMCIARRKVHVSRFWRRDSMWLQRGSGSLKEARVSRGLRFCIMDVISGGMKFEQLRRMPDIRGPLLYLRRAMPKYADTRNSGAETAAHKSMRCRRLWDARSVAWGAIGNWGLRKLINHLWYLVWYIISILSTWTWK